MPFDKNVFVNCPFDKEYKPILNAILFSLVYLDFEPQISETTSSEDERIKKIKSLILDSKYGIHDLSRSKCTKKNDIPRFNMPYELGLDVGCFEYRIGKWKDKKFLIFNDQEYKIQAVLSDINGKDIEIHHNQPEKVINSIRHWFYKLEQIEKSINGSQIWFAFSEFTEDFKETTKNRTPIEIESMSRKEYIDICKDWIERHKIIAE